MNGVFPSARYQKAANVTGWEMRVAQSPEDADALGPDWQPADVFFGFAVVRMPADAEPPAPAAPPEAPKTRGRPRKT